MMDPTRLLLVEDHFDTRTVLSLLLGMSGYQVDAARDATQALEFVVGHDYDICILDLHLPDRDGIQLCRELKAKMPTVPMVFYSAIGDRNVQKMALNSGANRFIVKPVLIEELEAALDECLGRPVHHI